MTTTMHITEATTTKQSAPLKVDRDKGVIHGVKVCGRQSKNGRLYDADVLTRALPIYEGVSVYLDHGLEPGDERPMRDHFGNLQNVRMTDGEMFADLHYLRSHSEAEAITERAERFPHNFGLSHDAEIESIDEPDGVQRVTEITAVNSVDLVTRPATNSGIFEQEQTVKKVTKKKYKAILESLSPKKYPGKYRVLEQMELTDDPMLDTAVDIPVEEAGGEVGSGAAIKAAFRQMVMAVFDDDSLDSKATNKKIGELIKQQEKLTSEKPAKPATEEEGDDEEDVAESEDDEEIVEAELVDESDDEEEGGKKVKESVRQQNRRLRKELRSNKKTRVIESVLKEQKIKPTNRLVSILKRFDDRDDMVAYLEGEDVGGVLESEGIPIRSAIQEDVDDYESSDFKEPKELISSCRTFA